MKVEEYIQQVQIPMDKLETIQKMMQITLP